MLFLAGDGVADSPVLFQEVAFVYEIGDEGEGVHVMIDQWIFELCESQDDISAGSSY